MHDLKAAILAGYNLNVIVFDDQASCGTLSFRLIDVLKQFVKESYEDYEIDKIHVSEYVLSRLEEYLLPMPTGKIKTKFQEKLKIFETSDELGEYSKLNKYFTDELKATLPAGDIDIGVAMLKRKLNADTNLPEWKPMIVSY